MCANGLGLMSKRPIATLTTQQLGRFAEYFVTMALVRSGMDVYTPAVDDRGIDLIARIDVGTYLEVQVKATRGDSYVYVRKSVFPIHPNRYLAYVSFNSEADPDVFLIPSTAWATPNRLLASHDYVGRKSPPEYGLNLSPTTRPLLDPYRLGNVVNALMSSRKGP